MAGFTRHAGRQVGSPFGHWRHPGKGLTVVAISTTANDASVVHQTACESTGISISRSVAGLARGTGRQVVRWLGLRRHSNSKCLAVVTSCTAAAYAHVLHYSRTRTKRGMTDRTRLCRGQMIGRERPARRNQESHRRGMTS